MRKKKISHLDEETLFDMGRAEIVQQTQLFDLFGECLEIKEGLDELENKQLDNYGMGKLLLSELEVLVEEIDTMPLSKIEKVDIEKALDEYEKRKYDGNRATRYDIRKTREVITNNNWDDYLQNIDEYAKNVGIDESEDPFLSMLGENEYKELAQAIDGEFAKKTSIKNKVDLCFLGIAIALEVTKGLLYPIIAEQAGYGQSFDPDERLTHDDKSIEQAKKKANDKFKEKNIEKKGTGKWIEFLYQTVPYDITAGTGAMDDINLHGGAHRLYTLGHDPILGWVFGTANIMTDVITVAPGAVALDSNKKNKFEEVFKLVRMRSYRVARNPARITTERVSIPTLFRESYEVAREHSLNLPAAIFAEGQHLKSDVNTKMGLPVPVVEMFSPEFASKLYSNNYDALCLARDLKIVGKSAAISILIDTIIGLVHGLYYNPEKDGSRELYEVRTRKLLLIANTIGTSSNIIYTYFSKNLKALDIGGLLMTLTHVFSDTKFLLNVKKEFVENKLYEKIESEMQELDEIEEELMQYAYRHQAIYN